MPYDGWTLAHVRAASHGGNTLNNTHPFIKGNNAMIHNGIFQEYAPVKAALSATHKFKGQTDSEVAAVLYQVAGKQKFVEAVGSGAFMFLNRMGRVNVICKNNSDLVFQNTKHGVVMASSLPEIYKRKQTVREGVFTLGKNGKFIYANWEKDSDNWKCDYTEYSDYAPRKSNWKAKRKVKVLVQKDDFESSFTDRKEFIDAQDRGYIWYDYND